MSSVADQHQRRAADRRQQGPRIRPRHDRLELEHEGFRPGFRHHLAHQRGEALVALMLGVQIARDRQIRNLAIAARLAPWQFACCAPRFAPACRRAPKCRAAPAWRCARAPAARSRRRCSRHTTVRRARSAAARYREFAWRPRRSRHRAGDRRPPPARTAKARRFAGRRAAPCRSARAPETSGKDCAIVTLR